MVHYYLVQGRQTQLTPLVYRHAEAAAATVPTNPEVLSLLPHLLAACKTVKYIYQLPKIMGYIQKAQESEEQIANEKLKTAVFRKRDLHQVLQEGIFPSCSDIGLLFRGLMIAQGFPTAWVETFHEDYILGKSFQGHVFGRVFYDGKSDLINPKLVLDVANSELEIFPYLILKEGLDSWDIGIEGYDDLHRLKAEHLEELIARHALLKQQKDT